ncbi:MAG: copper chaperone [Bacteroidetes bacterium]|nr:MAG: copper chaperone [Bacteroidota bacterium]
MKANRLSISLFTLLILLFSATTAFAQGNSKSKKALAQSSFPVSGLCGMCKYRIESALDVKGVRMADWNPESGILTVSYNAQQVTDAQLHEFVAAVGHDTPKVKAKDEVYKTLPGCCRYRDGVEKHHD